MPDGAKPIGVAVRAERQPRSVTSTRTVLPPALTTTVPLSPRGARAAVPHTSREKLPSKTPGDGDSRPCAAPACGSVPLALSFRGAHLVRDRGDGHLPDAPRDAAATVRGVGCRKQFVNGIVAGRGDVGLAALQSGWAAGVLDPAQVERALPHWIPGKVTAVPEDLLDAPETLRTLLRYLEATGLRDPRAPPQRKPRR
jgi:hypothetical protein